MKYLVEESIVLVPAAWVLGMFLKKTPIIPNWTIPWILLVFSVGALIVKLGFTIEAVVQGILVAGAAVFSHQLMKQTINRNRF